LRYLCGPYHWPRFAQLSIQQSQTLCPTTQRIPMTYLIFAGLMALSPATITLIANAAPVVASRRRQASHLARQWAGAFR
jgi:hypothetical protein